MGLTALAETVPAVDLAAAVEAAPAAGEMDLATAAEALARQTDLAYTAKEMKKRTMTEIDGQRSSFR